jgi:hypothetical protein
MHVEADVAAAEDRRLSRVDAHAHADGELVERALSLGGGEHGIVCTVERVEERVALRVDFVPCAKRFAQPAAVLLERLSEGVGAELGQQARGLLDVREEEGDGAARQLGHALNSRRWATLRR